MRAAEYLWPRVYGDLSVDVNHSGKDGSRSQKQKREREKKTKRDRGKKRGRGEARKRRKKRRNDNSPGHKSQRGRFGAVVE